MADIREIDMPQAKDANGKKIRLVGDDGKGYWMNFDDLAAVVGALQNVPICKMLVKSKIGMTVAQFKLALVEDIRDLVLAENNVRNRMAYLVSYNASELISKWDNDDAIVQDSGQLTILITSISNSGKGYARLQLTSYAEESKWAQLYNGVLL